MNRSADQFDELGLLTAGLCDGEITPDQAARLEQLANQSSQTREFFLRYVQLHGELHWENAASAGRDALSDLEPLLDTRCSRVELAQAAKAGRPDYARKLAKSPYRWITATAAVASLLVVALLGLASYRHWLPKPQEPSGPVLVARLTQTFEAKWSDGTATLEGADLVAGQQLNLRQGLAEIRFLSGARLILEGPATFDLDARDGALLHAGKLTANVPGEAAGVTIRTPSAVVVDRGTEFGMAVDENGRSEVHVFAGTVAFRPSTGSAGEREWQEVRAGHAVAVPRSPDATGPQIDDIPIDSCRFVRGFPGTVAGFRNLVACHPDLIHHYTFEGDTPQEKRQDKKGDLDLIEVVMYGGSGEGRLEYSSSGPDPSTNAVMPYRAPREGNSTGLGLQTEKAFYPPRALTVELLLSFEGFARPGRGQFSAAIATREDQRHCGFFVVAAEQGRLVHLMDGDAPSWVEGQLEFIPGEWYYVASTFRVEAGATTISTYAANITRGEQTLRPVVEGEVATGVPAASRLGIGKGFARDIAHAYPWCGGLDEVAIYDAALDRETLEKHLTALVLRRN